MLILSELIIKVFLRKLLPVFFFRSEILGNGKSRHDRGMVDRVIFYFIEKFQCIAQRFRHIGKELVHLFSCLHPFLLGIEHTGRIIQILTGTQTDQTVMCFGIFFIHEMNVICTNQLDIKLLGIFHKIFVHLYLQRVALVIGPGNSCFMALHFKVKIIAEQVLIPLNSFFRFGKLVIGNPLRYLATETSRTNH